MLLLLLLLLIWWRLKDWAEYVARRVLSLLHRVAPGAFFASYLCYPFKFHFIGLMPDAAEAAFFSERTRSSWYVDSITQSILIIEGRIR